MKQSGEKKGGLVEVYKRLNTVMMVGWGAIYLATGSAFALGASLFNAGENLLIKATQEWNKKRKQKSASKIGRSALQPT